MQESQQCLATRTSTEKIPTNAFVCSQQRYPVGKEGKRIYSQTTQLAMSASKASSVGFRVWFSLISSFTDGGRL